MCERVYFSVRVCVREGGGGMEEGACVCSCVSVHVGECMGACISLCVSFNA